MDLKKSSSVDTVQLAQRMTHVLRRPFIDARIVDRGAYASVYQLIEGFSAILAPSPPPPPVVIRISSRPAYNDVAIDQERQKIAIYVATLNFIRCAYRFSLQILLICPADRTPSV